MIKRVSSSMFNAKGRGSFTRLVFESEHCSGGGPQERGYLYRSAQNVVLLLRSITLIAYLYLLFYSFHPNVELESTWTIGNITNNTHTHPINMNDNCNTNNNKVNIFIHILNKLSSNNNINNICNNNINNNNNNSNSSNNNDIIIILQYIIKWISVRYFDYYYKSILSVISITEAIFFPYYLYCFTCSNNKTAPGSHWSTTTTQRVGKYYNPNPYIVSHYYEYCY